MKEFHKINMLYDFYGSLLTEKQQRFIELYYADDLSLGEIAEQFGVTRQAVHDTLKRAEQTLVHYEGKLGLVDKFNGEAKSLKNILGLLHEYHEGSNAEGLVQARELLQSMLLNRQDIE